MISSTGISYLLVSIGLGLFAFRFYQAWQSVKGLLGKLLFYFLVSFCLVTLCAAIGGLFFTHNQTALFWLFILSNLFLAVGGGIAGYLICWFEFPQISPWYGFWGIFALGILSLISSFVIEVKPFLDVSGAINWDFRFPVNFFQFLLYLFTFPCLIYIFFRQFCLSKDNDVKAKALGMVSILFLGFILAYTDLILEPVFQLTPIVSDFIGAILGILMIILIVIPILESE